MRLLFAISVISFCTVLWLALSLARRIRRDRLGRHQPAANPPAMEFFEAGEFRTPRALRLNQEVTPLARRSLQEPSEVQVRPRSVVPHVPLLPLHPTPRPVPAGATIRPGSVVPQAAFSEVNGSEAVVIDSKLHFIMAGAAKSAATLPHGTPAPNLSGERKSPQSARSGTFRRVDLSHYNEDMGDLTDPYTHTPGVSGVRTRAAKSS